MFLFEIFLYVNVIWTSQIVCKKMESCEIQKIFLIKSNKWILLFIQDYFGKSNHNMVVFLNPHVFPLFHSWSKLLNLLLLLLKREIGELKVLIYLNFKPFIYMNPVMTIHFISNTFCVRLKEKSTLRQIREFWYINGFNTCSTFLTKDSTGFASI